jgi:hypothetical protein
MNKKLYILKSVSIANNKVISDGRLIYSDDLSTNFKAFSKGLYRKLNCDYSKFFKMDNLCKLSFLTSEFLTLDLSLDHYQKNKTAIVLSNSGSTLETDLIFTSTLQNIPSPAIFVYTLPNIAIGEISIKQKWKGENLFFVDENINSENILEQVEMLFSSSDTELCLTGWVDYISESEYKALFWLVTGKTKTKSRIFSVMEIQNDIFV